MSIAVITGASSGIGREFAKQIKESRGAFIKQVAPDCIVPVPLHPSKQRSRGFNQVELLAEALGKETGIPVRNLLKKHIKTKDQKSLVIRDL